MEQFKINGVAIAAPSTYSPVFATTSTDDSDRAQDGVMHNTPMFTIGGYDMTWDCLGWDEIAVILNQCIGRSSVLLHYPNPRIPSQWQDREFYCSNFNMDAQTLEEGFEIWEGLQINFRSVNPE